MITMVQDLAAEALFVSDLQPSEQPTAQAVHHAITTTLLRYGSDGCAAAVAAEFGDHPDAAVTRMSWARAQVAGAAAQAGGPQPALAG